MLAEGLSVLCGNNDEYRCINIQYYILLYNSSWYLKIASIIMSPALRSASVRCSEFMGENLVCVASTIHSRRLWSRTSIAIQPTFRVLREVGR